MTHTVIINGFKFKLVEDIDSSTEKYYIQNDKNVLMLLNRFYCDDLIIFYNGFSYNGLIDNFEKEDDMIVVNIVNVDRVNFEQKLEKEKWEKFEKQACGMEV